MGCELPEYLRQYYLDTMGITCWQSQQGFTPSENVTALNRSASRPQQATVTIDYSAQWLALERAVAGCEKCAALCQSRAAPLLGKGNRQADVLVIDEAPNAEEDAQGEPFVGRSGNLMTAMLKAIQLDRRDVYMVNIIKCRPPKDRKPGALEVENCASYLREQIALIQPKVILAVGAVAAQNLLASATAVSELRGQPLEFSGIPVIVTYHPNYLLHKPSEKRKAWQDLLRLQALISSWQ